MAHDVFVSHSSKDKTTADAVCAILESNSIRCWVAPRDILPGEDWGESIVRAIRGAKVMVLVFSAAANTSPHILREVERAVSGGITIIPMRIEEIVPTKALEYFLSCPHWLDAFSPPMDRHLQQLAQVVQRIIRPAEGEIAPPAPPPPPPPPVSKKKFLYAGLALLALVVIILIVALKKPAKAVTGGFLLQTDPPGVEVFSNGQRVGVTPYAMNGLPPGPQTYRLKTPASEGSVTVTVEAGLTKTNSVSLSPRTGTLSLSSDPPGAEVWVDGQPKGPTPLNNLTVEAGQKQLMFKYPGLAATQASCTVSADTPGEYSATFAYGGVEITSEPPLAVVSLAGKPVGSTPFTNNFLAPGSTTFQLSSPSNYESSTVTLQVPADRTTIKTNVELHPIATKPPEFAHVTIDSTPEGAEVWVDGAKQVEVTPIRELEVAPGLRKIEVRKNGTARKTTVTLQAGDQKTLPLLVLPAHVTIFSTPSRAEVYVDGVKQAGTTPLVLDLDPGERHIEAQKDEAKATNDVVLQPGEPHDVNLTLPALVTIDTTPSGADVYVDGVKQVGTTTLFNYPLAPGTRHIVVQKEGATATNDVSLDPGEKGRVIQLTIPVPVKLIVHSEPPGATISYRNESTGQFGTDGTTPGSLSLPPGEYLISVSLEGYQPASQPVPLDKPQLVDFPMTPVVATARSQPANNPVQPLVPQLIAGRYKILKEEGNIVTIEDQKFNRIWLVVQDELLTPKDAKKRAGNFGARLPKTEELLKLSTYPEPFKMNSGEKVYLNTQAFRGLRHYKCWTSETTFLKGLNQDCVNFKSINGPTVETAGSDAEKYSLILIKDR
jgi:hypothetical protein